MTTGSISIGIGLSLTKIGSKAAALDQNARIACVSSLENWDSISGDLDSQSSNWDILGQDSIWSDRITADGMVRVPAEFA